MLMLCDMSLHVAIKSYACICMNALLHFLTEKLFSFKATCRQNAHEKVGLIRTD